MQTFAKVGLDALLTPQNCVLLLIDHQPFQLANVNSHDPTIVINDVTALAKTARAYGIPTILTTVNEERGGLIFKQVQAVFPDQKTINRTHQLLGGPPDRRGSEEDGPEEACNGCALDGDVSCDARYTCDG
ncbi:MAG: hypothetical protein WA517_13700 [Candidatus Acidiferrum sp.]